MGTSTVEMVVDDGLDAMHLDEDDPDMLSDFGESIGVSYIEIDKHQVLKARKRVPAWGHNQLFEGP